MAVRAQDAQPVEEAHDLVGGSREESFVAQGVESHAGGGAQGHGLVEEVSNLLDPLPHGSLIVLAQDGECLGSAGGVLIEQAAQIARPGTVEGQPQCREVTLGHEHRGQGHAGRELAAAVACQDRSRAHHRNPWRCISFCFVDPETGVTAWLPGR